MASQTDVNLLAKPSRALPTPQADGNPAPFPVRSNRYGELVYGQSARRQAADDGCYFVATNVTPGTGIVFAAAGEGAAFAAATKAALFVLYNRNPVGGKRVYLDRLKLFLGGTAPTGTLQMDFAFELDDPGRVTTAPSNQVLVTAVNVNGASDVQSQTTIWFPTTSPLTVTTATVGVMKLVGRASIITGVAVVGDEYELIFGEDIPGGQGGATAARATDPARRVGSAPPIIVAPQQVCVCRFRWITQAANAWTSEFELGFIER